jgi:type I restriction enzyme S subunit
MSFPKYPRYKESGVEWLGEVPEHWEVKWIKRSLQQLTEKTPAREKRLGLENIESWTGRFVLTDSEFEGDGVGFRPGDILFGKLRPYLAKVLVAEFPGAAVGDFHVLRPQHGLEPRFAAYQFLNPAFISIVDGSTFGSKMPRASWEFIGGLVSAMPPPPEQQAIARFLDREAARIDVLITEQQRLIELLKEKRQAVISHAVTRGLNPDAPMKPSGVEWLGVVPADWDIVSLKRVASVMTGVAKGKNYGEKRTISVPYLRVANVQDGYLNLTEITTMEIPEEELDRYRLLPGDVLMNEGGDFDKLGRGHVWEGQIEPCITQNHVFAVRSNGISPEWLSSVTSSSYAQFYFMTRSKQSTNLASISSTNLMELPVVIPPPAEVEEILAFLRDQIAAFETLTGDAERAIVLLQERRKALISAAVTGKIDVRGLAEAP